MSETPETPEELEETPIQVIIKKEEIKEEPDFNYDNINMTEKEIEETEKEISEKIAKRVNQDAL